VSSALRFSSANFLLRAKRSTGSFSKFEFGGLQNAPRVVKVNRDKRGRPECVAAAAGRGVPLPSCAASGAVREGGDLLAFLAERSSSADERHLAAPVRTAVDFERVVTDLGGRPDGGLVLIPDVFLPARRNLDVIVSLASRYRVPTIYPLRPMVAAGGLISYGIDVADLYRRAASYVDRILKGAKPSELPVQLPTKFELAVNLKTAKALGLEVPSTLLALADEVIE
jgi:hypothetical protein